MRIALIGPVYPYRGGIAHYTTRLYHTLQERRHRILLVSFKRQYPQWLFPGKSDRDPSKKPVTVQEAQYWIDSMNPFTWLATFFRIRAYQPEAIILQWWVTFWAPAWWFLGTLCRLFLRCPLIFICHNVLPHEVHKWDPWLARLGLRPGTLFIAQSEAEKRLLLNLVPGAQVQVFPLPAFDMFSDQQISKELARQKLRLPQDLPILLFFGIVREYKGLADLLAALPRIREDMGQVRLLVAGEFWDDKQPYLDTIQQLDIDGSVVIDDRYIPNEEAGLYFSAADALVAPYRQVTGSAVIPMARAFGLPVITTLLPGIAPIVDNETDLLVPPADPDALAAAAVRLLANNRGQPQPSRPRVDRFSWEQLAALLEGMVREAQVQERTR